MQPWKFLFLLISLYLQINKSITSSTSTTTIPTTEVSTSTTASTTASTTSTTIPVTTTPPTTQETTTSTVASATTTSTTTTSNVANVTTTSITTTSTTESTTISTTQAPIQPEKPCNSTKECVANATCTNAKCQCDNSFYAKTNDTVCTPRKLLGENCDDTTLCIHNASCSANRTCNCNESYYNNSGTCNERTNYASLCKLNINSCQVEYNCTPAENRTYCLCPSSTFRNSSECVSETLLLVQNIRNNTDYMERNISIVWDRLANFSDPPIEYEVILNNGNLSRSNNTFAVFTDLTPGTRYSLNVTARRRKDTVGNNTSQQTSRNYFFYTRPSVPDNLLMSEYPGPNVNVTFNKSEGGVKEYIVTLNNSEPRTVPVSNGSQQSVQFDNLIEGDTYYVTIISVIKRNDTNETINSISNLLTFKVLEGKSGPVQDLKSSKSGTSWIYVTWSKPQSPRGRMTGYLLGVLDSTDNKCRSAYVWHCAGCSSPYSDSLSGCQMNITNKTLNNLDYNANYPFSTNVTGLESDTNYTLRVYTYNGRGEGENSFITARTDKDPPQTSSPNVGAIVGGVIGGLAFIAIVVVIIFFIRRSRWVPPFELIGKRRDTGLPRLIKLRNFAFRLEQLHKDSNRAFMEEFQNLQDNSPDMYDFDAAMIDDNKGKNRYVNILPYEHTRVKLSTPYDDPVRNFINANYVPGYSSPREYIATQGPMMSTLNDFWRMIWEQNACIIVMLSDLTEKGRPKVELYWPKEPNTPTDYGDITVEMTACSQIKSHTIRTFQVSKEDESRQILQYFLPGWEDYDANLSPEDILDFIQAVRKQATSEAKSEFAPIIIHCSAGVGRTGTYIALDFLMQFVDERNDLEAEVDIFNLVLNLRHHRPMMVQSEKQYIFIYDAMKVIVERKVKAMQEEYNENVYQNTLPENIYANEAFVPQEENLYENTDKLHRETTAL